MELINTQNLGKEMADAVAVIRDAVDKSFADIMFTNLLGVAEFEKQCRSFFGVKYAVCVSNGEDALRLGLRSIGIKRGDEIITAAFAHPAVAKVCIDVGATPVFADIDENTMNISPAEIEKVVSEKTAAILPVHVFGNPADMKSIMALAEKHNLKVVEDCGQSFGASIAGLMTGTFGDAGAFSFSPYNNLGAYVDGGMIVTNYDDVADLCREYKERGSEKHCSNEVVGYNGRLDDVQAAILGIKMKHIDRFNAERRRVADLYRELIGDRVVYQNVSAGGYMVYQQFVVRVKNRDGLISAMKNADIDSPVLYSVPCHLQETFKRLGYKKGDLPVTEKVSDEALSLSINPHISDDEVKRVADIIVEKALTP